MQTPSGLLENYREGSLIKVGTEGGESKNKIHTRFRQSKGWKCPFDALYLTEALGAERRGFSPL